MVKDHSDSETCQNLLPPHGLLFPINSKGSFICSILTDRRLDSTYHGLCYPQSWSTGWKQEITQWVHPTKVRSP